MNDLSFLLLTRQHHGNILMLYCMFRLYRAVVLQSLSLVSSTASTVEDSTAHSIVYFHPLAIDVDTAPLRTIPAQSSVLVDGSSQQLTRHRRVFAVLIYIYTHTASVGHACDTVMAGGRVVPYAILYE